MLKEKLLQDLKECMKEKNTVRKNVIQMVRASILQVEKDKQIEVNDDQILEIIAKESKKRKDSLADYEKSGRESAGCHRRGKGCRHQQRGADGDIFCSASDERLRAGQREGEESWKSRTVPLR